MVTEFRKLPEMESLNKKTAAGQAWKGHLNPALVKIVTFWTKKYRRPEGRRSPALHAPGGRAPHPVSRFDADLFFALHGPTLGHAGDPAKQKGGCTPPFCSAVLCG
jgi:hypothetical protein